MLALAVPIPARDFVDRAIIRGFPVTSRDAVGEHTVPSALAESVTCVPFPGQLPAGLEGDPCPSALKAVRAIVKRLDFQIARIYIEPGPFICGDYLWPGIGSPPVCYGPLIIPGTMMRGWVAFHGTDKVAAVELRREVPRRASPTVVPPWKATVLAFIVPPTGWVMP